MLTLEWSEFRQVLGVRDVPQFCGWLAHISVNLFEIFYSRNPRGIVWSKTLYSDWGKYHRGGVCLWPLLPVLQFDTAEKTPARIIGLQL